MNLRLKKFKFSKSFNFIRVKIFFFFFLFFSDYFFYIFYNNFHIIHNQFFSFELSEKSKNIVFPMKKTLNMDFQRIAGLQLEETLLQTLSDYNSLFLFKSFDAKPKE